MGPRPEQPAIVERKRQNLRLDLLILAATVRTCSAAAARAGGLPVA